MEKTKDAVKILHNRYLKGHPIRQLKICFMKLIYKIKDKIKMRNKYEHR
jgi:hypothetical protein